MTCCKTVVEHSVDSFPHEGLRKAGKGWVEGFWVLAFVDMFPIQPFN